MYLTLCAVLALFFLLTAQGVTITNAFKYTHRNPFINFWVGILFFSLALMAFSLFVPISMPVVIATFMPSIFGFKKVLTSIYRFIMNNTDARHITFALTSIFIICFFSFYAASAAWTGAYDTDLYHAQIIEWLTQYGAVKGVGNLHARLAHNSAWLLVAAALNHGPLIGSTAWILPPLMLTSVSIYFLYEIIFSSHKWAKIYAACFIPSILFACLQIARPNLYYDFPAIILCAICCYELLHVTYGDEPRNTLKELTVIIALATLSFLIKPLALAFVVFIPLFAIIKLKAHIDIKTIFTLFMVPFIAASLWCTYNAIVSGYLVFPLTWPSIDVDWRMPLSLVDENRTAVQAWARMPNAQYTLALASGISFWFPSWLQRTLSSPLFVATVALPLFSGIIVWGFSIICARDKYIPFFFSLVTASILSWFWIAPDLRFGREFFMIFFACGAAICVKNFTHTHALYKFRKLPIYFSLLVILVGTISTTNAIVITNNVRRFSLPTQPAKPVSMREINHEGSIPFRVYVPIQGDQCGRAQLPCAPYFSPSLNMREPGKLGNGFNIKK